MLPISCSCINSMLRVGFLPALYGKKTLSSSANSLVLCNLSPPKKTSTKVDTVSKSPSPTLVLPLLVFFKVFGLNETFPLNLLDIPNFEIPPYPYDVSLFFNVSFTFVWTPLPPPQTRHACAATTLPVTSPATAKTMDCTFKADDRGRMIPHTIHGTNRIFTWMVDLYGQFSRVNIPFAPPMGASGSTRLHRFGCNVFIYNLLGIFRNF